MASPISKVPRVLITGAAGFTGKHLVAFLQARGGEVMGLTRDPPGPGVAPLRQIDLLDPVGLVGVVSEFRPNYVVHLGAISHVRHGDAGVVYAVNVVGTTNLLQALIEAAVPVEKVLLASSANVYGWAAEGIVDELTIPAPVSHYGCSKLAMEHMSRSFGDKLPVVIARSFNYTGVGHPISFVVPKIVDHFRRRMAVIELGNIDVVREFNDVRAVVEVYDRLLASRDSGFTVNVCSGRGHSLRQIVEILARLTGHELEIRVNPAFVRANEIPMLVGSTAELERRLGAVAFRPLESTLSWMLEGV